MGDPIRALQAGVIIKEIKSQNLLENVRITGKYLKQGLVDFANKFPDKVAKVRGEGTFLSFTCPKGPAQQAAILTKLRQNGVEATGCGEDSIRMRPMLIFAPRHAAQFLDILQKTLTSL
jgi:4-aminobutyrate aminotransferase/(S)-3-amino-2-methylpropionate transaminase